MKTKKPSKLDELARETQQEYSHSDSGTIFNRRSILAYEVEIIEGEIVGLQTRLLISRERKARLTAQILGLGLVIEKR